MNQTLKYSKITDNLYIGQTPKVSSWAMFKNKNIKLVINMRAEKRVHATKSESSNISVLWVPTLDFILFPISQTQLNKGVEAAKNTVNNSGNVYVHCKKARHRSVAMVAAILISNGMTDTEAIELIKAKHPVGDPEVWHIKRVIKKFYQKNRIKRNI